MSEKETAVNDPELKRVGIFVGAGLVGVAILNSVYQAGVAAGIGRDGRYVDHDGGLFPFPLLLIGGLVYFLYRRRRGGSGPGNGHGLGGGPRFGGGAAGLGRGASGPPRFFEEWHRRAHEAEGTAPQASTPRAPWTAAPEAPRPAAPDAAAPTDGGRTGANPTASSGSSGPTSL